MAKHRKYKVEKTKVGLQYVIPGADRMPLVVVPATQYVTEGEQFIIPGAERISTREFLTRKMAQPISPRSRQRGLVGTALFGGQQ
jgi:hypothetical protein